MSKTIKKSGLQPDQLKAIDLWFAGLKQGDIASVVGVAQETLSRWTKTPEWQAEVKERTAPAKERATAILLQAATDAANTLALKAKASDVQAAIAILKAVQVYVERQERVNPDAVNEFLSKYNAAIAEQIEANTDADTADRIKQGINSWLASNGYAA